MSYADDLAKYLRQRNELVAMLRAVMNNSSAANLRKADRLIEKIEGADHTANAVDRALS